MGIITVTGHRPDKLGGYRNVNGFKAIRRHMRDFLEQAPEGELRLISGGALGIDQFWMEVGLHLNLPVIAALPFKGYNDRWPDFSRKAYDKLFDRCEEVLYVSEPGYSAEKLQVRNEWMVNNSDALVAYWTGVPGGTSNCIGYAQSRSIRTTVFDLNDII